MSPITVNLKENFTFVSVPGGGLLVALILNILDELIPVLEGVENDPLTYHRIAEVFKYVHGQHVNDLEQVN